MAHHVAPSHNPNTPDEIGRLTISAKPLASPDGTARHLRISRVVGGLRFTSEGGVGVHVHGEDLFALREMLAEVPEELFVRPADPVEEKSFWSVGDSFVWNSSAVGVPPVLYDLRVDGWYQAHRRIYRTGDYKYGLFSEIAQREVEAGNQLYFVIHRANA